MPEVDFPNVPDAEAFEIIPAGSYVCKLVDITPGTSQAGNEKWSLIWEVTQGEHAGARVWDSIVFAGGALKRVKLLCSRLGLDVTEKINLQPEMIMGRSCIVHVEEGVWERKDDQGRVEEVPANEVPFAGYEAIDDDGFNVGPAEPPPHTEDDMTPF
jgi:hypothetical protein